MWPPALSPNWTFAAVLYRNGTYTLKNKCWFQWEAFSVVYCFHSFTATIIPNLMIKAIVLLGYRALFNFFFSGLGWSRMCSNSCSQLGFHHISDWPDYFPNDRIQNWNHIRTHWSWFCFWCSWSFSGGSAGYMSSWAVSFFFFLPSHGGLTHLGRYWQALDFYLHSLNWLGRSWREGSTGEENWIEMVNFRA